MRQPKISVAVCTFNRYSVLPDCLASLESQTLATEDYEVLILDNSDDQFAREAFWTDRSLPTNVRLLKLEKSGLSNARNVALEEAAAPLIAFIDDDALACAGWLQALLGAFNSTEKPTVVFGPVQPIWPNGHRPAWVTPDFESAFTVLDLGRNSRVAGEHEHGFGANVAFSVKHARRAGGFLENLGRHGRSLMSGEDLHLQTVLYEAGQTRCYAAEAIVEHHVHEDRLSRSWLMARFAWQAASDRVEGVSWSDAESVIYALRSGQYGREVADLFKALFKDEGPDYPNLSHQLSTIKSLVAAFLALNDLDDRRLSRFGSDVTDNLAPGEGSSAPPYRWAPSIAPDTRLLVAEGAGNRGHNYLVAPLRLLPHMQEIAMTVPVDSPCPDYDGIFEAISGRNCKLFLPTLDNHLYWLNRANFTGLMDRHAVKISGFLHRLPDNEADVRALQTFGQRLEAVFVFAPQIELTLREQYGLDRVYTLPHIAHHAPYMTMSRTEARRSLGIPDDAVVLAQMGEQRPGKGLENLLEAIPHLSDDVKRKLFVLLVGKAQPRIIKAAQEALTAAGVAHRIDLADNGIPGDYAVVSPWDYATRIVASDYGCLMFDGPQKNVMSGAISDYLSAGVGVIAAVDTVVGKFIANLGAGHVISNETPKVLAGALDSVVRSSEVLDKRSSPMTDYLRQIDPKNVATRIASVLEIRAETGPIGLAEAETTRTYESEQS
ncbi:glycosyl transferase family 2 [Shimia isoporae]|uniref:Glycosyl transferase family 2 n=1 Tax=Shimia isoporae TaxID=647720 RepID=A0A4V2Q227_9RHOB|nr:glycosyltransferase [Shimia isoporae]TCL00604.1 glycosyl transferase family 2 [Shimia isoporae]